MVTGDMGDRIKFEDKKKKKYDLKKLVNYITPEAIKLKRVAKESGMTTSQLKQYIRDQKSGNTFKVQHERKQQEEMRRDSLVREIYGERHSVNLRLSEIQREVRGNLERMGI